MSKKIDKKEEKNTEQKVKKIIPSKLETGFQQFLYKTIGVHIPKNMTPNQVTLIGAIGGLIGMYGLRHKTQHWYFVVVNFLSLIIHIILGVVIYNKIGVMFI